MSSAEATPDLCVIGASEAGLAACMGGVALGLSCILVDDGDPSGLRNPDLALAALAVAAADRSCHAEVWTSVAHALARAAPERRHARFAAMNVGLVRGTGRFADAGTLLAGERVIRARRFFIATGGRQPAQRLTGSLADGACLSLDDLLRGRQTPQDILVVGDGPRAVSAAQSLARLGSRVTLAASVLLPGFNPELTAPLVVQLRRDGVALAAGDLQRVEASATGIVATLTDGASVAAAHLLLAEEGRPALQALDLGRAGIASKDDTLLLDAALRTRQRHIFAVGRAAGARSSSEGAAQAGRALRAAFLPVPSRPRAECVSIVTATQPQVAVVGSADPVGEARVWRWPLDQTGAGLLHGNAGGQVKVTTDRRGRILHVGLIGPELRELVSFWALAIARGLTLAQLADVIVPTPSFSESARALALQDLGRRLGSPWLKHALRAARLFG